MKKFLFLSIGILSIVVSCEPLEDPPPGFGAIAGFTFIKGTNEPLPDIKVTLPNYGERTTDVNGSFEFEGVAEGEHTVSFYKDSKLLLSKPTTVKAGNTSSLFIAIDYADLPKKDLPDFFVVDISQEFNGKLDYWVAGKDEFGNDHSLFIDAENSLPKFVVYRYFKTGKDYGISFDEKGLPKKVFADGYIFLFDNFNGNKVDLAILSPSGESQIIREIQTDFVWPTSSKGTQSKADIIRWTGRILAAIPCVTSAVASVVTGGVAIPLALWTCGNYFLSMANNFFDDANVENGFTKFVNKYHLAGTIYTCTDPNISSCLVIFAQVGLDRYADYIEEMEEKENSISQLEMILANNTPLKEITIQPGSEGKDAWISLASFSDPCREFYSNSGNDSLINVIYDAWSTCSKQVDRMLIQFPLDKVPANALVVSAKLEVYGY
ncbi:MAG: hypothetical protein NTZ83_05715, partial [Candidatus Pacearchaeota archaeon]|nr:hypothetical protein [Candidatus Pacearchaeota archaeon]